ncbi:Xyloglucan endo-transglycosylase, C-terminal [Dillenia turbinata]|uniref:Xyloglucan endotransglucosylase/hydrolase n=1 Tax=Dillenia turbinata TaxID=194707 RepID=A0AAN8ULV7_9MAGN
MSSPSSLEKTRLLLLSIFFSPLVIFVDADNFINDIDVNWGSPNVRFLEEGNLLTLSLDKNSGSGFQSKNEYLFVKIDIQIKLVPENSAGTVTTFYLSSLGQNHDEIDLEFLGNLSGNPYTLHTNVYAQGKGNREQQFKLWFDPTKNFHKYSVIWNPQNIIFLVDNIPIRELRNKEYIGVPFPNKQAMRVYSSIWNADDWATMGGRVKIDWTKAPFTASYRNFNADGCVWSSATLSSTCASMVTTSAVSGNQWQIQQLNTVSSRRWLKWVQKYHMIYNYCSDYRRFPQGLPPECNH